MEKLDADKIAVLIREHFRKSQPLGDLAFINEIREEPPNWKTRITIPQPSKKGTIEWFRKIVTVDDNGKIISVEDEKAG